MFLVVVAIFGVVLALLLMLQVSLPVDSSSIRRPFISALYSAVCFLGIVAVFYPSKCRLMFQKPKESSAFTNASSSSVQLSGHHPNCENFSGNRITIRGRAFCAACCGLLIGAIASMIGVLLLSLGLYDIEAGNIWIFAVGIVLMLVGLAQIKLGGYTKVAVNALFVIGSGISLIVADLVGQNLLLDVYVLGLIIYMLWLRILLSEWNNRRICMNCQYCS
jgi:hypothetical protein